MSRGGEPPIRHIPRDLTRDLVDLIKYLLMIKVTEPEVIEAIKEHIFNNESLGILSHKYGIGKHRLRGYIQRIRSKVSRTNGILRIALECVDIVDGVMTRCPFCGLNIRGSQLRQHIYLNHSRNVIMMVSKLIGVCFGGE